MKPSHVFAMAVVILAAVVIGVGGGYFLLGNRQTGPSAAQLTDQIVTALKPSLEAKADKAYVDSTVAKVPTREELKTATDSLRSELSKTIDDKVGPVQAEADASTTAVATLNSQVASLKTESDAAAESLTTVDGQVASLKSEADASKADVVALTTRVSDIEAAKAAVSQAAPPVSGGVAATTAPATTQAELPPVVPGSNVPDRTILPSPYGNAPAPVGPAVQAPPPDTLAAAPTSKAPCDQPVVPVAWAPLPRPRPAYREPVVQVVYRKMRVVVPPPPVVEVSDMPTAYCDVCKMFKQAQQEVEVPQPVAPPPRVVFRQASPVGSSSNGQSCFWVLNRSPTAMVLHVGAGPATQESQGLVSWRVESGQWEPSRYYPGFLTRHVCVPNVALTSYDEVSLCGDVGFQNFLRDRAARQIVEARESPESDPACIAGSACPPQLR